VSIPTSTFWEIRGTGSNLNGGGFDPASTGTDFSQAAAARLSLTDLACAGSATAVVTSVTGGLLATMVGNVVQIASGTGFTPGFYSVASWQSATQVTLDRTPAAAAAAATGGTCKLGGALSTYDAIVGVTTAGNTVFFSGATVFSMTALTIGVQTTLIGYAVTRGDNGQATFKNTSGTGFNAFTVNAANCAFYNLTFDATTAGSRIYSAFYLNGSSTLISNCKFTGDFSAVGLAMVAVAADGTAIIGCELTSAISQGPTSAANHVGGYCQGLTFLGNYVHDFVNTSGIITSSGSGNTGWVIEGNVFVNCPVTVLNLGSATSPLVINNLFYNCGTGVTLGSSSPGTIKNNIFAKGSAYGISCAPPIVAAPAFDGNSYWSNTSGTRNGIDKAGGPYTNTQDVILTADPCVNAAALDFRLNNAAGGGAAIRGKGYPVTLLGQTAANALDMGAYQHATPALGLVVNSTGTNPVLTWDADPRAVTGYVISRGTTATNKADIATVALATTTYTDTTATSGTFFYGVASY